MPIEAKRKLILLGKQSVISLPRGWVAFWKLQKKQPLQIMYNSILVIIPPTHPNRQIVEQKIRKFLLEGDI